jgi:hypothetical protein
MGDTPVAIPALHKLAFAAPRLPRREAFDLRSPYPNPKPLHKLRASTRFRE